MSRDIGKYKFVKIEDLVKDPSNARVHPEKNILLIMNSLKNNGQRKPIVLQGNKIIAGHGTVEAAKRLGWLEIEANTEGWESEEEAKAYALVDNRTGETSSWDFEQLTINLKELEQLDIDILDNIGFDINDFIQNTPDYSLLEGEDNISGDVLDDMRGSVRKAIQIEFELEHYEEAQALVKFWREQKAYVGMMLMDKLKAEKSKL